MNVLVYASSASHGLSNALRSVLSPFYTVQSILPASLATQPWTASCALLVLVPPDAPAPFSLPKQAHETVQQYISAGGRILGIGLGATLLPYHQAQERFGLWDAGLGTAIVPECPQGVANHSPSSIILQTGAILPGLRPASVSFVLTRAASDAEFIRGRWEDVGAIAGIQVPVGSGRAAFWGISPRLDGIEDTGDVLALLRYALTSLELSVPRETIPNESSDPLPAIPGSALPQFLLHQRGKRHISDAVLRRLGLESSSNSEPVVIKDREDTFHFHKVATLEHGARLVSEARASADTSSRVTMATDAPRLIIVLPPDVLPTEELTPRFNAEKYFAVLAEIRAGKTSSADGWGVGEALFYAEAVTSTQTMLERYVPRPSFSSSPSPPPKLPNHRNPKFLASLPAPIVSLATFQLSGRGRGSNAWLSPQGCLQFSILVRVPLRAFPASRLVFVQYLAGLAIVRACRDGRVLGAERGARVLLKWPNDVYVDLPSSSVAGSEKKKVGGVLVNMNFADGNADVIVGAWYIYHIREHAGAWAIHSQADVFFGLRLKGCGINVCTPSPVTALSLLSRPGERLEVETVLALVLTEFERLWNAFVAGGGRWAPFEEDYLDAWMHSCVFRLCLAFMSLMDPSSSIPT